MPTYDYQCENGHRFEVFQKMTDPKLDTCPECGGRAERLIGPGAGLVFKGSGFYSTDYRSETYKRAAKSESGGGAAGAGGASGEPATGGAAPAQKAAKAEKPVAKAEKPAAKAPASAAGSGGEGQKKD